MEDSRKKLYDTLSTSYNLGTFDEFSEKLNNEDSRRKLYDKVSEKYNLGTYEEYSSKLGDLSQPQDTTAAYQAVVDSGSDNTKEVNTTFGEGFRQEARNLGAGLRALGGEALNLFTGSSLDDRAVLNLLNESEKAGMSMADYTKQRRMDMLRSFGERPYEESGEYSQRETDLIKQDAEILKAYQDALDKAGGNANQARKILEEEANNPTRGDIMIAKAADTLSEAKENKGWAWLGGLAPQTIGNASAIALAYLSKGRSARVSSALMGTSKALGLGSMASMTGSTAGMSMVEARQSGASDFKVWATGLADAAIEWITEKIPFDNYTKKIYKAAKNKITKGATEILSSDAGREELEKLLKKANEELGGKLFSGKNVLEYIKSAGIEAGSEALAEALQTLTPIIYQNPEEYPELAEVWGNALEGMKGGLVMGAFLGGASNVTSHALNKERRKSQGYVDVAMVQFDKGADAEVVEVLGVDDDSNVATVLRNGEQVNVNKNAIQSGYAYRFSYADFENARLTQLEDEAIDTESVTEGQAKAAGDRVAITATELENALERFSEEEKRSIYESAGENAEDNFYLTDEVRPAYEAYRDALQREKEVKSTLAAQQEKAKDAIRTELEAKFQGPFYQQITNEDGTTTTVVETGTLQDGRRVYIISEVNEAGEALGIAEDGQKMFVKNDMLQGDTVTRTIVDFLDERYAERRAVAEQERMASETQLRNDEVRSEIKFGSRVNLGTKEAERWGTINSNPNADGAMVLTDDGEAVQLSMNDLANMLNKGAILTDTEKTNAESAEILSAEAALKQERAQNVQQASNAVDEAVVAKETIKESDPLPLKQDGSVDQTTLWNQNPERWAEWNDEQRQDGGVNSLGYINAAITREESKVNKLTKAYDAEPDFDVRASMEPQIKEASERINRLVALQQKYAPLMQAEAQQAEIATEQPAPKVGPSAEAIASENADPVRQTLTELYNDPDLSESEIEDYINANVEKAQSDLDKHIKKAPKMGTDMAKYKADRAKHQEQTAELERQRDFWKEVQSYVEVPAVSEMDMEPQNALEFTAKELTRKDGVKLLRDSFARHTGYGSEAGNFLAMLRSKDKGGLSLEEAGERLMEMDRENNTGFFDQNDPNAGLNAILDVISGARTSGDVSGYIRANREQAAKEEVAAARNAMMEEISELTSVLEEDLPVDIFPEQFVSSLDEDMPNFRDTSGQATDSSVSNSADAKKRAVKWAKRLGIKVNVIEDISQVKNAKAREAIASGKKVAGWYETETGEVYIYIPNAQNVSEVDKTIIHEVISHKGLRGLLGKKAFDALCDSTWKAMSKDPIATNTYLMYPGVLSKERLAEYNANPGAFVPTVDETRKAADEFIAHRSESLKSNKSAWEKLIDNIKRMIHKLTGNYNLGENLDELLERSLERYEAIAKMNLEGVVNEGQTYQGIIEAATGAKINPNANTQAEGNTALRADNGSLVGMHNISEGKLRKAIKQGGLANPSTAVVNIASYSLEGFGDISLIMPSSLVDSEAGDNIGTYTGDAWTPTYPTISRQIDDSGWKIVKDRIRAAVGESDDLYHNIVNGVDNYLSDDRNSRLEFVFLKEKGIDPKIELKGADGFVGMRNLEAILGVEGLRDGMESYEKYKAASPMAKRSFNTWQRVDGDKKAHKALKDELRQYPQFAKLMGLGDDLTFAQFDSFTYNIFRKEYDAGNINTTDTLGGASRYVDANDMRTEFEAWLESLMQEAGAKEVFFAGWTRDGDRIYKDNTLENVSRHMRMQGRTNAYDDHGLSATKSALLRRLTSLAEIRKNKARLQDEASYNKAYDELKERLYSVISQLADMEKISDNPFMNIDYAEARLQEAIVKRNPIAYLNSEYGYNIDVKGEYAEELKSFIKDVQKMPAKYFETKFERPVYLNEFAAAVMPTTTSEDIKQAVSEAGLPIFEYDSTVEGSRKEATLKATEGEGIRFRTNNDITLARDLFNDQETDQFFINKDVDGFNRWLKEHSEDVVRLYHGTGESVDVANQGLLRTTKKRRRSYQSTSGYVYLSLYPSTAQLFGELAYPYESTKVYAVDVKIKELKPDFDQLANKRLYDEDLSQLGNSLAESLIYGGGARVKRDIFPYELSDIRFRVRGENESAEDFLNNELGRFRGQYSTNAKMAIVDYTSRESIARTLGISNEELSDDLYNRIMAAEKKSDAVYLSKYNTIAIFAREEANTSGKADNIFFHENVHEFLKDNAHWLNLGQWLLDNSNSGPKKAIAERVKAFYPEQDHAEEMLCNYTGLMLSLGRSQAAMNSLPEEMKPIWEEILNKFNYNPEYEDSRRKSDRSGDEDARRDASVQMRNASDERARGARVTWTRNDSDSDLRFRTTEITPEVRDEMAVIAATALVNGNYMKAPNGADTNLTAEQWAMVRTKNFKKWFGNWENDPENASKVVDENGEPMVVYHGSPYGAITEFNRKGHSVSGLREFGTYFSTNHKLAQLYAYARQQAKGDVEKYELEKARLDAIIFNDETPARVALDAFDELDRLEESQKPKVYEVFLNIRKPKVFDAERSNGWDGWHKLKQDVGYDIKSGVEAIEAIAGHNRAARMDEQYDGIIAKNMADVHSDATEDLMGDIFLVFDETPANIKSATDNTGEFSEGEGDIRYRINENPTEAQKEAGNYKMGHLNLDGYRITIENPKGTVRRGIDSNGNAWENTLNNDYGYIRGTEGVDGDHIDVYLSDNPTEGNVFVIDQVNPQTREFDEHKVMYGFNSAEEAREAYLANFSEGWNGLGTITEVSKDEFKKWIQSSHRKTKPFSEYKSVNAISMQSEGISEEVMTGTPTDEVVASGLALSLQDFTRLAGDIYEGLPSEYRTMVGNAFVNGADLQQEIFRIPSRLVEKQNLTDEDIELAKMIADKVQSAVISSGIELSRPLTTNEALWMLDRSINPPVDVLGHARSVVIADNLGFSPAMIEQVENDERDMRYRAVNDHEAESLADVYNQSASYYKNRLYEVFVDQYDSVDGLIKAIENATGKPAQSFEDVRYTLNQLPAKSGAKAIEMARKYIVPMWDAVKDLVSKYNLTEEQIARYTRLKHGLERNEEFPRRDAREFYRNAYDKKIAAIEADDSLEDFEKQSKKVKAQKDLDFHLESIERGSDAKFQEFREKDYSGIMAAYEGQYDNLADAEQAAREEVESFEAGKDAEITELWKRINALNKATLKVQYESGQMSKALYDSLKKQFEYYVPLRGFMKDTAEDVFDYYSHELSGFEGTAIRAEGRTTEAESPFGHMAAMMSSAIVAGEKNAAKLPLYYFALNRKDQDLLMIQDVWYVKRADSDEWQLSLPPVKNVSESIADYGQRVSAWEESMKALMAEGKAKKGKQNLRLEDVVHIEDKSEKEHYIRVMVNGQEKWMIVNGNPRAAQAINGLLNIESDPYFSKFLGKVMRELAQMSTSYNPEFWMTNLERDLMTTFATVSLSEDKEYTKAFVKNYRKAWSVIKLLPKLKDGTLGDAGVEGILKEAVGAGLQTGYSHIKANEIWDKEMEQHFKDIDAGDTKKAIKSALGKLQTFSESMELVSRFAVYMTSREMGRSIEESVANGKEVTANFNRKGSGRAITFEEAKKLTTADGKTFREKYGETKGAIAEALVVAVSRIAQYGRKNILFFNASIQGLDKWMRLARKNKGNAKKLAAYFGGQLALGFIVSLLYGLDDDDEYQENLSDYDRRNNFMIGGNGYYIKIALPHDVRAFYGMGDILYNYLSGNYKHHEFGESFSTILKQMLSISPVNVNEGWQGLIPDWMSPAVEAGAPFDFLGLKGTNKDFSGMPIRKETPWLTEEELKHTPKYTLAGDYTWDWLVDVSEALNRITGGNYKESGVIDIDPARIQHYIEGWTGGIGRTTGNFATFISQIFGEEEWKAANTPFLNKVFTITDERSQNKLSNSQFYAYRDAAETSATNARAFEKDKENELLRKEKSSDEYKIYQIYNSRYKKAEQEYTKQLKVARNEQEEKRIKELRDANRKRFLKELSDKGLLINL